MKRSWLTCCAATLICSCQPALVNLPPLSDCPPPTAQIAPKCEDPPLPPPIPEKFYIRRDGNNLEADPAADAFFRTYRDYRREIKMLHEN
jgi:hypothetical protein